MRTYAFEYRGAKGTVRFPVPATDPRLAELERYRKAAKAERGGPYFIVKVDNTAGSEDLYMEAVDVYDAHGAHMYEGEGVGEWIAYYEANKGGPTPPRNAGDLSKVARRYEDSYVIPTGEKGTLIYFSYFKGRGTPARVLVTTAPDGEHAARATRVPDPTRQ